MSGLKLLESVPPVTIIIVNYNGLAFIDRCLCSVESLVSAAQVIVVDNGSVDGSLERILECHPGVGVIRSGGNIGFGRACNLAAERAKGEFLLLLNYDAELITSLEHAVEYLRSTSNVAMLGGRLFFPDGRSQSSVGYSHTPARIIMSWLGLSKYSKYSTNLVREIHEDDFYDNFHENVDWITGALMLVRKSIWDRLGGMNPGYFLYMEDVDFCFRLKAIGERIDYTPFFSAIHLKGGGSSEVSLRAVLSTVDSYWQFLSNHRGKVSAKITLGLLGVIFLVRAVAHMVMANLGKGGDEASKVFLKAGIRALRWSTGQTFPWGPPDRGL